MTTDSPSGAPEGGPGNAALRWAADVLGCADVAVVCGLREGGAVCFGVEAVDLVLAGWEEEAGYPVGNVGYWDAVAALSTPPDMAWVTAAIADQGRPDLNDRTLLNTRRDAFLRQALTSLGF